MMSHAIVFSSRRWSEVGEEAAVDGENVVRTRLESRCAMDGALGAGAEVAGATDAMAMVIPAAIR
jgi:hypothetical protein